MNHDMRYLNSVLKYFMFHTFRFKNRELQIMRRLDHCNIVSLLYFFYTSGEKKVLSNFIFAFVQLSFGQPYFRMKSI